MKLNRVVLLLAALLPFVTPAGAQNESLASIFTNSPATGHRVLPRRPSIILIACHGLGFGDLSCYGQTNFQTPNLDRLASEGTRFTDYRVTGDNLATVQGALMAGNNAPLSAKTTTLATRLQLAGYHTGLIGEWTLGPQPWTQGFDEFAGYLNEQDAKNPYSDFMMRYMPRTTYNGTNQIQNPWIGRAEIHDNVGGEKGQFIPDLLMSAVVNFIRVNHSGVANHYQPFFLLVNLPVPQSVTPGKNNYPVPTDAPFTGEKWPQAAKNRAALLTRLDDDVGRLFEELAKVEMSNNIAIFFTGGAAPEKFAHTNMDFLKVKGEVRGGDSPYRLRVPMIVHWPARVPAGRVSSVPWSTADFAPTAMDITYEKPAASFAGISVLPVLTGKTDASTPALPEIIR